MLNKLFLLIGSVAFIASCKDKISEPSAAFQQQWYQGKAEINSYDLQQARYGEIRDGEAVLIFVTEDFSTHDLVKLDDPSKTDDKVRVLKMNMTKKFVTGIYPYSMMLSVFTPLSGDGNAQTLKADCSSQEWCGHTFSQLRLDGSKYKWMLHSYFEKEGEQEGKLDDVLLEDEIWTRLRINPKGVPQGNVVMLPGLLYQRLSHDEMKKTDATITILKADTTFAAMADAQMCTIAYAKAQRTLKIYFNGSFPHQILGWKESYPDGFGPNKKMLTTIAVLKKTIWTDYWKHNTLADSALSESLQLKRYER